MSILGAILFTLAFSQGFNTQSPRTSRLQAVQAEKPIIIDGRLDEAEWARAAIATNFIQSEPDEGLPASEPTEVRVLYDKENIYIGVTAHDSEIGRVISELNKDFNRDGGDAFTVLLDTFHDQRNGYMFATNAAGAKWDAQTANEGRETNANWDGVWFVKAQITDGAWAAEIGIPFKTLKFTEDDPQTWGINFHRNLRRRNEDTYWSAIPRIYNIQRVSLAGSLEGLRGIKPGSNIKLKPSFTASTARTQLGERKSDADFGFDAKYGVTSGLTWDFTYNTDFSQVEADEQQINLTRFSLFFPEKREFFLENSGILDFGSQARGGGPGGMGGGGGGRTQVVQDDKMFFSRRIGLSDDGGAIPILAGTRLTGRAAGLEVGFLNVQQKEFGEIHATNFTVGRVRRNLLANSDVGLMVLNKEVLNSPSFNRVYGADANFQFGTSLNVNSYLAKSSTPAGGSHDLAARTAIAYLTDHVEVRTSYTQIQENFVNEMGFVPRQGTGKFQGMAGLTLRPESLKRQVRIISPHIRMDYVSDEHGKIDTRFIDYHVRTTLQDGSSYEIGVNRSLERFTTPFNIKKDVAVAPGTYLYDEYFITGSSDPSRKVSVNGRWALGPFYTGYKHTYQIGGKYRFNYKFNASLTFTQNNINLAAAHYKANLLSSRLNYSFSTIMFLNAFIQYNNDARQWSSNIRFNIIHRPLSDVFIVYNERRDSVSGSLIDRALIGKLTYMISR